MSGRFDWERAIRALPLRPPVLKLVALVLATYADRDGANAHPGEDRLAEDCGMSPRSVRRHLAELRELGLIERVFKGSSYGRAKAADEYRLIVPADIQSRVAERLEHRSPMTGDDQPITGHPWPVITPGTPDTGGQNTGHPQQNTGHAAYGTPDTGDRPPDHDQGRDQPGPAQHPLPASSSARARDDSAAMDGEVDELIDGTRPHAYRPDPWDVACETCELPQNHPRHIDTLLLEAKP
ncbi:DNA-binding transcriptional ArsR family regulator [Nocardioides luteus]|uniref:Helix-turn-helix domain-containing protein n=1 Tax=Nocardioides luteus TaxID=1844 RepID=A0ABQ5SQT4_9ACTN|nr:helix-turn-helix domain-containing protein [Nocardioides luteus]MDR7313457.1 DNA-binding transcriptional ArsR family regulator [Nocardioides luteus]GGR60989.1 hypothetical protein GCM10010197_30210 [Nocardioides luteus]GLJ66522.1 hypothetical protein GCM10017579_05580 [Nocardioides luteus]